MPKIIGRILRMSSLAAALAVIVSLSAFTLPSFAATTSPQARPHEGGCAPAVTYDWNYKGSAKANTPGGGIQTAKASISADFKFNGSCGVPSVNTIDCNLNPRVLVTEKATNCYANNTGDISGDVWAIGDNSVVYSGVTLCTIDVELGSDYYGDYNTYTDTNC